MMGLMGLRLIRTILPLLLISAVAGQGQVGLAIPSVEDYPLPVSMNSATFSQLDQSAAAVQDNCAPKVQALPLLPGADGGYVFDEIPGGFVGYLHHPDGTSAPAIWQENGQGGYTTVDLGLRDGLTSGFVSSATSDGTLLVVYDDTSGQHGRTYIVSGDQWKPLLGPNSEPDVYAIVQANSGDVVGSYFAAGTWQSAVWRPGQPASSLRPLSGFDSAYGWWINDRGDVVGQSTADGRTASTVWPAAGRPLPGPRLSAVSGPEDVAYAVADNGRVGGSTLAADGHTHAIIADPYDRPVDLGTFPGDDTAHIFAIAPNGHAVGDSQGSQPQTTPNSARALYWPGSGPARILPGLSGAVPDQSSAAFGVNDTGTAWGTSTHTGEEHGQPTVWTCVDQLAVDAPATTSSGILNREAGPAPLSLLPRPKVR